MGEGDQELGCRGLVLQDTGWLSKTKEEDAVEACREFFLLKSDATFCNFFLLNSKDRNLYYNLAFVAFMSSTR